MIKPRRLAVRGHWAGIANAIFVGVRRDSRHLLSLARRQSEIHLGAASLHRELTDVPGRRETDEGRGLLRQRRFGARRHREYGRQGDGKRLC